MQENRLIFEMKHHIVSTLLHDLCRYPVVPAEMVLKEIDCGDECIEPDSCISLFKLERD